MTQSIPVLDFEVFDEMSELMGDSLADFITTYLENSPKLLNGMEKALPIGDLDAVFHNAHQLKGGSGSIGAMRVFEIAKKLEEEARAGRADTLNTVFSNLKIAYEQVVTELSHHL